jgi:hypothetical protein
MTFHAYGRLLKGNRTFQKAVVAYKNAISALDADNYPVELTAAHNNCGAVLLNLAESEENSDRRYYLTWQSRKKILTALKRRSGHTRQAGKSVWNNNVLCICPFYAE